jgi:shikimate kinase
MKLVLLFGPQAVGKMTVGHELEKVTELKLFHNHMTIDLVTKFFDYRTKEGKASEPFSI